MTTLSLVSQVVILFGGFSPVSGRSEEIKVATFGT